MALLPPPPASLVFTVTRHEAELVVPDKPIPHDCQLLSDIDDQKGLRYNMPGIHFYRYNSSMEGKDPAKVIKKALAQALVFYYPFAGRLREAPKGKLMVDCTGEGVLFMEADADVTFDQFGDAFYPPFSCFDELLFDVPASKEIINCPLLQIQVTRLKCGGFIFAHRVNHAMTDALGLSQFMSAMGEMARGLLTPSIPPVWERHLLTARQPPLITCVHPEYDGSAVADGTTDNLVHRSFYFGPTQISALRTLLPQDLQCSTFDVITACLWRCRTKALEFSPDEDVSLVCIVNVRSKFNPPLPLGYYGNAFGYSAAITTAGTLCQNPIGYAVELVKQAKAKVTEEFVKSMVDLIVTRGRKKRNMVRSFLVSDLRRAGLGELDFGWGEATYLAPAASFDFMSFYIPYRNNREVGILVPVSLQASSTMETFVKELDSLLKDVILN